MTARVLIADDDEDMRDALERGLSVHGFDAEAVSSGEQALERLEAESFDVLISDLHMEGMSGIELCTRAAEVQPGLPVVVLTAFGNFDAAVEAMRAGAYDFLTKPVDVDVLALATQRAANHARLRREVRRLRKDVAQARGFGELVGKSPAMQQVFDLVARASETDASVLITGESGTGKELVAHALHERSKGSSRPFVAINCAAMPETLLESELFGHTRGSFTGATADKPGLFVRANSGTLFLDEIGDMQLTMQAKLLRALQERTVRPVGGEREVPFDVRLVAATNHDIESAIEAGEFREDLAYRINVIRIHLPPLRARGNDRLLLAQHLLERISKALGKEIERIDPAAAERILAYDWPGNVRELQNCMERAVALTRHDQIVVEDLPDKVRTHRAKKIVLAAGGPESLVSLDEMERRYIGHVLESSGENRALAARILGIDRKTLRRKLKRWEP